MFLVLEIKYGDPGMFWDVRNNSRKHGNRLPESESPKTSMNRILRFSPKSDPWAEPDTGFSRNSSEIHELFLRAEEELEARTTCVVKPLP